MNKKIKVAFFAHAGNLTGANRSMVDLTNALKKLGVKPIVIIPEHGVIEEELKKHRTKYYILPYQQWVHGMGHPRDLTKKLHHLMKVGFNKLLVYRAAAILRKESVDIIHSNSTLIGFGGEVAAYMKLPHVWHIRDYMEEDHHITFYDEAYSVKLMGQAARVVAISDVIAAKFQKKLGREVVTVYNGLPVKKYALPEKKLFAGDRIELMMTGRIVDTKGQKEAVEAVELLREEISALHLRIIGGGTGSGYCDALKDYVRDRGLEEWVEFVPFQQDISSYAKACDLQLVCSHNEAFGRVTIEGMLSHALVIGADAGCTPFLIHDGGNGLLFRCADPASLADVIRRACADREAAQRMADEGFRFAADTFSIERTAQGVAAHYAAILGENPDETEGGAALG